MPSPTVRVDKWLWAVRVYKTRSAATAACRGGHVKINGSLAKAASTVAVGDRVEAMTSVRRTLEVTRLIEKRVGALLAATCMVDHTPPASEVDALAVRDRGAGRPTKKDRRALERLRGR